MGLSVVQDDNANLVDELEKVRRRSTELAFSSHDKQGPLHIPILCRIIAAIQPDLWTPDTQVQALQKVLAGGIAYLLSDPLTDDCPEDMSWQRAAMLIWRLTPIPARHIPQVEQKYRGKHGSVKAANYVQEYALLNEGGKDLAYVVDQMRKQLAAILIDEEAKVTHPDRGDARQQMGIDPSPASEESIPAQERKQAKQAASDIFPASLVNTINAQNADYVVVGNEVIIKNTFGRKKRRSSIAVAEGEK